MALLAPTGPLRRQHRKTNNPAAHSEITPPGEAPNTPQHHQLGCALTTVETACPVAPRPRPRPRCWAGVRFGAGARHRPAASPALMSGVWPPSRDEVGVGDWEAALLLLLTSRGEVVGDVVGDEWDSPGGHP